MKQKSTAIIAFLLLLLFLTLGCQSQYMTAGKIYVEQNNYDAAIEQFKLAVQAEPNNAEAYIWLGKAYAYRKKYEEACKKTERALSIDPKILDQLKKDISFNYWAIFYNAGMKNVENKAYEDAIKKIKRSLDIEPKNISSFNLLAFCYMRLDRDEEALKTYEKAIELVPDNVDTYLNFASYFRKKEELEKEYEVLVKAKNVVENPDWLKGKDEDEIKQRKKTAASVYIDLGNNLLKQDKSLEAEVALKKAMEMNPDDKDVNFNYGLALLKLDKYSEAMKPFKRVVELDSLDEVGYYYLGFVYLKTENYADAVGAFTKAITLDSDYCEAYLSRAFAFRELGDKNAAYDDAKKGTECNEEKGER